MFSLNRIIGNVPVGALQPSDIQVIGDWACPGGAIANISLELRFVGTPGAPMSVATATSNDGTNGPPGSVVFNIQAWNGLLCGAKIAIEVRGFCSGAWTPWEKAEGQIDCLGCPRIQLAPPAYGACSGTPAVQDVTLSATVMIAPGSTSSFTWDFGDGANALAGTFTNTTGSWNTPITINTTHAYADQAGAYNACLRPSNNECPRVCVSVQTTCSTSGCPAISGSVSYGPCKPNLARDVTYTLVFNPPLPPNSSVQISWAYGGANTSGASSATQAVNTSGGAVGTTQHVVELAHRPLGYDTVATVVAIVGGQLCPIGPTTFSIHADPPACITCPTPGNPVTLTIATPTGAAWCAPLAAPLAATFSAQVNWSAPVPASPPVPVRFDWEVTGPAGGSGNATRQGGASVGTDSGWSGPGATAAGALDLSAPGTYSVSVVAVFGPNSGLPTDANGVSTCVVNGGASFMLGACQGGNDCPQLKSLAATAGCVDAAGMATGTTVTTTVDDPAGTAQSFDWDFGDPGSTANQMTTATPNAGHSYAAVGSYTVSCTVRSSDPNCKPRGPATLTTAVTIAACPTTPTTTTPPPPSFSCAALLWTSLIMLLVGAVLVIVGCLVYHLVNAYAGLVITIIGAVIGLIGLILFLIWWALCSRITACSVIIAALLFLSTLLIVFAVIALVLGIISLFYTGPLPCWIPAIVTSVVWGVLLSILLRIALAIPCLVAPGSAPPPAGSSSSPLTSGSSRSRGAAYRLATMALTAVATVANFLLVRVARRERLGLGEMISRATAAAGIRPCQSCHERARWLNGLSESALK